MHASGAPYSEDAAAHALSGSAPNDRQLKALNAEYETDIHFQNSSRLMAFLRNSYRSLALSS